MKSPDEIAPRSLSEAADQMQEWARDYGIAPAELMRVFHNGIAATPEVHDRVRHTEVREPV